MKHGVGSPMVWGAMYAWAAVPLHEIEGIMDRVICQDISAEKMLLYPKKNMPKDFIF